MTTTASQLPLLLEEIEVVGVERLSPSFVRVEFGSPALADLGVDGPLYDQRIKLIFPNAAGRLPSFEGADESWFESWMEIPEEERGAMRTYTVRELRGTGADTRLVVDFVIHGDGDESGPGGDWGAHAAVGQRVITMAPRRGVPFGGIEFAPGTAKRLLLVGDETAVPAVAAVLECLPATSRGAVFLEVPVAADVLPLDVPERRGGALAASRRCAPERRAARCRPRAPRRGADRARRGRGRPGPVGDADVLQLGGGHRHRRCGRSATSTTTCTRGSRGSRRW